MARALNAKSPRKAESYKPPVGAPWVYTKGINIAAALDKATSYARVADAAKLILSMAYGATPPSAARIEDRLAYIIAQQARARAASKSPLAKGVAAALRRAPLAAMAAAATAAAAIVPALADAAPSFSASSVALGGIAASSGSVAASLLVCEFFQAPAALAHTAIMVGGVVTGLSRLCALSPVVSLFVGIGAGVAVVSLFRLFLGA